MESSKNERLEQIRERCRNWYYCYKDRPKYNVSNLYFVLKYLETYSLEKEQGEEESEVRRFAPSQFKKPLDHKDADLLQRVWQELDELHTAPLMVGVRFRMVAVPLSEIKRIIAIFVFGAKRYKYLAKKRRRILNVSLNTYEHIEDLALLYFDKQIQEYE